MKGNVSNTYHIVYFVDLKGAEPLYKTFFCTVQAIPIYLSKSC